MSLICIPWILIRSDWIDLFAYFILGLAMNVAAINLMDITFMPGLAKNILG